MARRRCGQKAKAKRSWGQGTFSFIDNVLEKDLASFSVNKAVWVKFSGNSENADSNKIFF